MVCCGCVLMVSKLERENEKQGEKNVSFSYTIFKSFDPSLGQVYCFKKKALVDGVGLGMGSNIGLHFLIKEWR